MSKPVNTGGLPDPCVLIPDSQTKNPAFASMRGAQAKTNSGSQGGAGRATIILKMGTRLNLGWLSLDKSLVKASDPSEN